MAEDLFIGRKRELESLSSLLGKQSASLVVLKGRRRIGKSRLIEEFAKGKRFLKFAGIPIATSTTAQSERDLFAQQMEQQLGLKNIPTEDWGSLFSLLAKHTQKGRIVLLFDEISWMGSKDPLFLGKLKNAWDLEFKKNPQLLFVLCGSVSIWIEKNIISSTAFFGRISLFLQLDPLPLDACHQFLLSRKFHHSPYEGFQVLSVTGGIPWYLEHIQSGYSANDNIVNLCFRKEGILFNEFDRIFNDLFETRGSIYRSIVETLAEGALEFKALCKALKYPESGTMSEYLEDLILSGFITRDYTWSLKSHRPGKFSHFRLSDNYIRFYLKIIAPSRDRILRAPFIGKITESLPGWNTLMGFQFENLILANRKAIWKKLGIRSEDIVADNPYFQKKSKTKNGCQIDYLIQTRYNTLFACEIKFSKNILQIEVVKEMKQKLEAFILPKRFSCWPVLVHINGVSEALEDSGYFSSIIDFTPLLTEAQE